MKAKLIAAVLALFVGIVFMAPIAKAEVEKSKCAGLKKAECKTDKDCTWINKHKASDSFCKCKPGKCKPAK